MRADLADLKSDTGFKRPGECPVPEPCDFDKQGICRLCQLKEDVHPDTDLLLDLVAAMEGGMPVAAEELSVHQWTAAGEIRTQRDTERQANIQAQVAMMGAIGG